MYRSVHYIYILYTEMIRYNNNYIIFITSGVDTMLILHGHITNLTSPPSAIIIIENTFVQL